MRKIAIVILLAVSLVTPAFAAHPTSWKYTALGDSLATGFGASRGYVPRYQDHIQRDTGTSVSLKNFGENGWKSGDLYNALRTNRTMRSSVSASRIVTWNIGGNDLRAARNLYKGATCGGADNQNCLRSTVNIFKTNWDGILTEILGLRSTSTTIIRTMDIYNPYVNEDNVSDSWANDGGLNDFQVFKQYLDEVNGYIATTAGGKKIPVAAVYTSFNDSTGVS